MAYSHDMRRAPLKRKKTFSVRKHMRDFRPNYVHHPEQNKRGELKVFRSLDVRNPPTAPVPRTKLTSCWDVLGDPGLLQTQSLTGDQIKDRADRLIHSLKPFVQRKMKDPVRKHQIHILYRS